MVDGPAHFHIVLGHAPLGKVGARAVDEDIDAGTRFEQLGGTGTYAGLAGEIAVHVVCAGFLGGRVECIDHAHGLGFAATQYEQGRAHLRQHVECEAPHAVSASGEHDGLAAQVLGGRRDITESDGLLALVGLAV